MAAEGAYVHPDGNRAVVQEMELALSHETLEVVPRAMYPRPSLKLVANVLHREVLGETAKDHWLAPALVERDAPFPDLVLASIGADVRRGGPILGDGRPSSRLASSAGGAS